jgi:hypothetical protein
MPSYTWCTDPSQGNFQEGSGQFSSYYQYDSASLKLVRIRLELNRSSKNSTGETKLMLDGNRGVGFADQNLTKDKTIRASDFEVNNGEVLFRGQPMSQTPTEGSWVVDMSSGDPQPHFGNQVASKPNLPEGIETKHLSLLANQAMIDGEVYSFTASGATEDALSASIKKEVSYLMDNKPFDQITDDELLTKLKAQTTTLREQAMQADKGKITESMDGVEPLINQMNSAIENELVVPNETLETAYDSFLEAVWNVNAMDLTTGTAARTEAIEALQTAHDDLITTFNEQQAKQAGAFEANFDKATDAIEAARQASERMDNITDDYKETEQADSIDTYEESMKDGVEATEEI